MIKLHRAARTAVIAAFAATSVPALAQPTLLSHWKFDETSGASAADATGAHPGTVVNGATFVPGIAGNAINIVRASNQYVTMGDVLPMATGDFTLSAWMKSTSIVDEYFIGRHLAGTTAGYMIGFNFNVGYGKPNKPHFYTTDFPGQEAQGTTTVNDGLWHHIVGVYVQGSPSMIYVDGAPFEGQGSSNGMIPANAPFAVGGIQFPATGMQSIYNGLIDDAQVYSGGLCPWEVQWLFDNPGSPLPGTSVCYADCDLDCKLSIDDFICYQTLFALGDPAADCDGDAFLSIDDFICYQTLFAIGC